METLTDGEQDVAYDSMRFIEGQGHSYEDPDIEIETPEDIDSFELTHRRMIVLLDKIRRIRGLSNKDIAEIIGKTPNYVSILFSKKIQRNPGMKDMAKISSSLGIPFFVIVLLAEEDSIKTRGEENGYLNRILNDGKGWLQQNTMDSFLKEQP